MKHLILSSLLVTASVAVVACDRSENDSSAIEQRLQELEREKIEDQNRQRALEQELADQKIAMEWEAIERERLQIEETRTGLAAKAKEGVVPADAFDDLQERDNRLILRENIAEGLQQDLLKERRATSSKKLAVSEADLAFAGRLAGYLPPQREVESETVDFEFFQDSLSSYGSWYESAEYGSVWQPAACRDPAWRPYTRGQWVCSDRGWTWVSTEPFGWATYHYGRWALTRESGWIWVPGTEWAPSWCTWRTGDNYIGWAPLPPETLAYQGQGWDSQVEARYGIDPTCFNFVKPRYFDRQISNFCVPVKENPACVRLTQNVTNIQIVNRQVFSGGPGYRDLSEKIGRPIPYCRIERSRESYERPNKAHLRSRLIGDRLVVAAPAVVRGENRRAESMRSRGTIPTADVKRSASADPEALAAYQRERARVAPKPRIPAATEPVEASPLAQALRSRSRVPATSVPRVMPERPGAGPNDGRIAERVRPAAGRTRETVGSVESPPAAQVPSVPNRPRARVPVPLPSVRPRQVEGEPEDDRVAERVRPTAERPKIERRGDSPGTNRPGGRTSRVPNGSDRAAQEQARQVEAEAQAEQARNEQLELDRQAQQTRREEAMNTRTESNRNQRARVQTRQREDARQKQQEEASRQREEAQRQQAEEARRMQQEEAQRQRAEEARRMQQEEAQRQRAEEARRMQQEEAQRQRAEEARREQQEEAQRQRAEEARRQQQEEAQRQRAEEDQRRQQEKQEQRRQPERQDRQKRQK